MEHIAIKKIVSYGETELFQCNLEFSQDHCVVYNGAGSKWRNEKVAWGGTISFVQCVFGEAIVAGAEMGYGMQLGGATVRRTISNVSNQDWKVHFETFRTRSSLWFTHGNAYHDGVLAGHIILPAGQSIHIGHTTVQACYNG